MHNSPPPSVATVVVGGGMAGAQAAIYLASEGHPVILMEREHLIGGQIRRSPLIENLAGHLSISGDSLVRQVEAQLAAFGVDVRLSTEVDLVLSDSARGHVIVRTLGGEEIRARSVLLATGLRFAPFPFDGNDHESVVWGPYYFEHSCDLGQRYAVIGGGNSAGQFAMSMAENGSDMTIIARSELGSKMSNYLVERIRAQKNLRVVEGSTPRRYTGKTLILDNGQRVRTDGVFCFAGQTHLPVPVFVKRDESLFRIESGPAGYDHNDLEIAWGVYTAGDGRNGAMNRVAAAMGDGARASSLINRHLATFAPVVFSAPAPHREESV